LWFEGGEYAQAVGLGSSECSNRSTAEREIACCNKKSPHISLRGHENDSRPDVCTFFFVLVGVCSVPGQDSDRTANVPDILSNAIWTGIPLGSVSAIPGKRALRLRVSKSILARDMIKKGTIGGDNFKRFAAADYQMK
jgi:hypothetical protein